MNKTPVAEQICKAIKLEEEQKISNLVFSQQVKIEHESSSRCINQNKPNWSSPKQESNAQVSELTQKQETDCGEIYTNESTLAVERPLKINSNEYQSGVSCQQEMKQTLQTNYQSIQNCFLKIENKTQEMQQTLQRIEHVQLSQNKQKCTSETKDLGNDAHGKISLTYQFIKLKTLQCLREMFFVCKTKLNIV